MFCAEATDTTATEDSRKPDSEKATAMVLGVCRATLRREALTSHVEDRGIYKASIVWIERYRTLAGTVSLSGRMGGVVEEGADQVDHVRSNMSGPW